MKHGFLVIDKPAGWTSFDVVAKVRGELARAITKDPTLCGCDACQQELKRRNAGGPPKRPHKIKVGHAGTLDPFATGVLVLAVGKATKQIESVMGAKKTYVATVKLGATTETLDPESEEQPVSDRQPTKDEVEEAVQKFVGELEQMPPKFSALKVDGKRAYNLARAGKEVKLQTRKVNIYSIKLLEYKYPYVKIETEVSKGTYIRSLARDIGEELGVGGYCSELRRTVVGEFDLEKAQKPIVSIDNMIDKL